MSKISEAYKLAETLHSSLYNDPENQTRGRIYDGEVRADVSEPYKTKRLTILGTIVGRPVYQHLSKSQRNGSFYLSTVFTEPNGEVILEHIIEETPDTMIVVLEETLLMQALRKDSKPV